ncbi:MAG: hypothetical protein WA738_00280 [Candidatus Angelobacter sp.]
MDPMTQGQLKEWFVLLGMFGLFGWAAYLAVSLVRRKQKNDMQKALLEKFSSAHDFAEFMQSPAGQKYILNFTDAVTSSGNSILGSIKTGCVLMFLGMGCLAGANGTWITFRIGWVSFLVGIGFLVSAAVSYFLAKKAGWKVQE